MDIWTYLVITAHLKRPFGDEDVVLGLRFVYRGSRFGPRNWAELIETVKPDCSLNISCCTHTVPFIRGKNHDRSEQTC